VLELPENSVWFGTIASASYDGTSTDDVVWEATLSDTNGVLGVPVVARYLYQPL
jgi:hypothetical protein